MSSSIAAAEKHSHSHYVAVIIILSISLAAAIVIIGMIHNEEQNIVDLQAQKPNGGDLEFI